MIYFVKKKSDNNQFDVSDIIIKIENETNMLEIINHFRLFLLAMEFPTKLVEDYFDELDG